MIMKLLVCTAVFTTRKQDNGNVVSILIPEPFASYVYLCNCIVRKFYNVNEKKNRKVEKKAAMGTTMCYIYNM